MENKNKTWNLAGSEYVGGEVSFFLSELGGAGGGGGGGLVGGTSLWRAERGKPSGRFCFVCLD